MTKTDIVRAAFRVWGRELYQTTSLMPVARELGVTKPALYRHFHNKQALLDRMYEDFFDEFAAHIKDDYECALAAGDSIEGRLLLTRVIADYYCRNKDTFIFSLAQVYDNQEGKTMASQLALRGVDLDKLVDSGAEINMYPPVLQLVVGTLTFLVANFHRSGCFKTGEPTEEQIREVLASIEKKITGGLEFNRELAEGIDFEGLEKKVLAGKAANFEDDELFQAVAGAVAETGPWKTSMGMVARRSGMSKSGLYAHFANKQDMLKQFFIIEFDRLVVYARAGKNCSELPEEQLYLVIFSIADYLRSRPEILAAANWMRTHRLDLGFLVPLKIYQVFLDIQFKDEPGLISEQFVDWMLFLIINTLMRRPGDQLNPGVTNESFRVLYRFVVLGIKGFME